MPTSRFSALLISSLALALPACEGLDTGAATQALADNNRDDDNDRHTPVPRDVPPGLEVGANEKLKLRLGAEGVQIYTCTATATGFAWVLKAPEANLFDEHARFAGNHFLGPTWQYKDGSKLVGVVKARATVDTTAIPWLLLTATATGLPGKLSDVTSIQRLHTSLGLAPATGCDATHVGTDSRVSYTADYYFYRLR